MATGSMHLAGWRVGRLAARMRSRFGSTTGAPPASASFLPGPPHPRPCPGGVGVGGARRCRGCRRRRRGRRCRRVSARCRRRWRSDVSGTADAGVTPRRGPARARVRRRAGRQRSPSAARASPAPRVSGVRSGAAGRRPWPRAARAQTPAGRLRPRVGPLEHLGGRPRPRAGEGGADVDPAPGLLPAVEGPSSGGESNSQAPTAATSTRLPAATAANSAPRDAQMDGRLRFPDIADKSSPLGGDGAVPAAPPARLRAARRPAGRRARRCSARGACRPGARPAGPTRSRCGSAGGPGGRRGRAAGGRCGCGPRG